MPLLQILIYCLGIGGIGDRHATLESTLNFVRLLVKTDTIFYRLFQEFPSIFFELIGQTGLPADTYKFTSIELKQLAFRLDGLFLPPTNQPNLPIYFVEVQFQKDDGFYYRLFAEIFLYIYQYKPVSNWRAVVSTLR